MLFRSLSDSFLRAHGEVEPPGAVVVPEVVVGVVAGETDGEAEHGGVWCGHGGTVWVVPLARRTGARGFVRAGPTREMDSLRKTPALFSQWAREV